MNDKCPLLAHSGHPKLRRTRPLSGVMRTSQFDTVMSAYDGSGHRPVAERPLSKLAGGPFRVQV
jgi:hypothetical protein